MKYYLFHITTVKNSKTLGTFSLPDTHKSSCFLLQGQSVTAPHQPHPCPPTQPAGAYQLTKIYRHLYPALFKLACDVDQFARNLFHPLVTQMIHWFTGNRHQESPETMELLDCIMDSLVDERDASLRDFSAVALREFLKWSLRHTPLASQTAATPVNVKSILKRIFSLLTHPSCSKRLGAALAWNSIYTVFLERKWFLSYTVKKSVLDAFIDILRIIPF